MILVTVGTTIPFDELIEEVDRLCGEKFFPSEVLCQTGHSAYCPRNCEWFRFRRTLDDLIERADVIICHGGTGSVLQAIIAEKRFVAFANPRAADAHQEQFLERLSAEFEIAWSGRVRDLGSLFGSAMQARRRQDEPTGRTIADHVFRMFGLADEDEDGGAPAPGGEQPRLREARSRR
jgi:beta-1,4-N-acetylglucosaminyltransferase